MSEKWALVTGASGGIGEEIAIELAKQKYNLILTARSKDKLEIIAGKLSATFGIKALIVDCDLSDYNNAKVIYEKCKEWNLEIDVLINNAGFGNLSPYAEQDIETITQMINLNITTLSLLTRYFLPNMLKSQNKKYIMNVASVAGFLPGPLLTVYYASKAYVVSFSKALSSEMQGTNVKVHTLCPGPIATGFGDRSGMSKSKLFKMSLVPTADKLAKSVIPKFLSGNRLSFYPSYFAFMTLILKFVPWQFIAKTVKQLHGR